MNYENVRIDSTDMGVTREYETSVRGINTVDVLAFKLARLRAARRSIVQTTVSRSQDLLLIS